jgi:hypothetical protein
VVNLVFELQPAAQRELALQDFHRPPGSNDIQHTDCVMLSLSIAGTLYTAKGLRRFDVPAATEARWCTLS